MTSVSTDTRVRERKTRLLNLIQTLLLPRHSIDRLLLLLLKHGRPCCLLDHREDLLRSHIENLGDFTFQVPIQTSVPSSLPSLRVRTLHDEEIGVVDIELDALEEVLDCTLSRTVSTNQVLARPIQRNLSPLTSSVPY